MRKLQATARTWKIISFFLFILTVLFFVLWVGEAAANTDRGKTDAAFIHSDEKAANESMERAGDGATVVVIDAGHGGKDPGCIGRQTGAYEKDINLSISLKVEKLLLEKGYHVVMTRTGDVFYGETKDDDFNERERIIAQANPDILVSIHQNAFEDAAECGPQMFYWPDNKEGEALSGCLQHTLNCDCHTDAPRTAQANDYRILKGDYAGCTVECGFLSNGEEEMLLRDDEYQNQVAQAVAKGIEEYAGMK